MIGSARAGTAAARQSCELEILNGRSARSRARAWETCVFPLTQTYMDDRPSECRGKKDSPEPGKAVISGVLPWMTPCAPARRRRRSGVCGSRSRFRSVPSENHRREAVNASLIPRREAADDSTSIRFSCAAGRAAWAQSTTPAVTSAAGDIGTRLQSPAAPCRPRAHSGPSSMAVCARADARPCTAIHRARLDARRRCGAGHGRAPWASRP